MHGVLISKPKMNAKPVKLSNIGTKQKHKRSALKKPNNSVTCANSSRTSVTISQILSEWKMYEMIRTTVQSDVMIDSCCRSRESIRKSHERYGHSSCCSTSASINQYGSYCIVFYASSCIPASVRQFVFWCCKDSMLMM